MRVRASQFPPRKLECSPQDHDHEFSLKFHLRSCTYCNSVQPKEKVSEDLRLSGMKPSTKTWSRLYPISELICLFIEDTKKVVIKPDNCQLSSVWKCCLTKTQKNLIFQPYCTCYIIHIWIALSPIEETFETLIIEHRVYIVLVCEKARRVHIGSYKLPGG